MMLWVFLCGVVTGIFLVSAFALAKAAHDPDDVIRLENERDRRRS